MPAGMKCAGGAGGNECIVRARNGAIAGVGLSLLLSFLSSLSTVSWLTLQTFLFLGKPFGGVRPFLSLGCCQTSSDSILPLFSADSSLKPPDHPSEPLEDFLSPLAFDGHSGYLLFSNSLTCAFLAWRQNLYPHPCPFIAASFALSGMKLVLNRISSKAFEVQFERWRVNDTLGFAASNFVLLVHLSSPLTPFLLVFSKLCHLRLSRSVQSVYSCPHPG